MDVSITAQSVESLTVQHTEIATTVAVSTEDSDRVQEEHPSAEEDYLGVERLLMSDTDNDDDGNEGEMEQVVTNKDDEKAKIEKTVATEHVERVEEEKVIFRTKMSRLIDTDSENEADQTTTTIFTTKTKFSTLVDSESEEEEQKKEAEKTNVAIQRDTDDSDDDKMKVEKPRKSKIIDTDSEDEDNAVKKKRSPKMSPLIDSDDSGDDDDHMTNDISEEETHTNPAQFDDGDEESAEKEKNKIKKKAKPMRASAKKALDEMQVIQSEQQRLHREAHISIPYHKPKRRTLQEFLKRRTIIKPEEGSPAAALVHRKSLKMTPEELAEYAKLMEERAKEATEFFKSESESEEEEMRDNDGVLTVAMPAPEETNIETAPEEEEKQDNLPTNSTEISTEITSTEMEHEAMDTNTADDNAEMELDETSEPDTPKVLITEVLELPKLDLSDVALHFSPPPAETEFESAIAEAKEKSEVPLVNAFSESVKRIIEEKNLPYSPSLKGDPNMLIDLETGDLIEDDNPKKPKAADDLLQRLLETHKARKHKPETVSILSTENGKVELSNLPVHSHDDVEPQTEQKPGAAYLKLKKNLKTLITKKRMEEMQRKQEEEKEYERCINGDDEEDEELDEYEPEEKPKNMKRLNEIVIDEEENAIGDDEYNEADDDEEEVPEDEEIAEELAQQSDNEDAEKDDDDVADASDDEQDDDDDEDDEDEHDNELPSTASSKSKNRIIKPFLDDSDDELDFLKTQNHPKPLVHHTTALYSAEPSVNFEDAESELMGLCSGNFSTTQKTESSAPLISQIPITQFSTPAEAKEELMEMCSGSFETQPTPATQSQMPPPESQLTNVDAPRRNKILSSDEENSRNVANTQDEGEKRVKKLTKRMKKQKPKLGFSDDEDEEEQETVEGEAKEIEEPEVAEEKEAPTTYIDYDSEENEIVVEMSKNECLKKVKDFFENEAELSESEWGSADEDEKNMDRYDIELGDEDEFDSAKIHTELGQIHARKMLDEDIREVRKIQEMLFEDEETDGVGRQRQFKWKNAESGFSLDENNREGNGAAEGESGDEENEHLWRKIRFEREQILKERGLIESSQDHLSTSVLGSTLSTTSPLLTNATGSIKKLNIITAKRANTPTASSSTIAPKKNSPFLISKSITAVQQKCVRGSFLVRDKDTLTKLAGLTKSASSGVDDMAGTAGTVTVKAVKSKNFVFATLTEEEHENLKRKADDLMNSSSEHGVSFMKKPKREPRREKCLIDQLL